MLFDVGGGRQWTGGVAILVLAHLLLHFFSAAISAAPPPPRLRPHLLPSLPSLDALFPPGNVTQAGANDAQLAWAHLRPPLGRSDALPDTRAAIIEASIAYLDLLHATIHSNRQHNTSENQSCHFSLAGNGDVPLLTQNSWMAEGQREQCLGDVNANLKDLDLVDDVDKLKAPPLTKKRILMLVGILSTGNNFDRRMALRRSWMQYQAVRTGDVVVRFFTGLHKDKQINLGLWKEAQIYGDIQLMPFVDYYSLITVKTIAICIFGTKILPAKYIMKTDDDAFVRIDEVLSSLKRNVQHGLLYGHISFESSPIRDKDSKWYISPEEWPHDSYPPGAHGPGYIISRDIAKFIVHGHQERNLPLFKFEDVAMGIWIREFNNSGQEINYVNDNRFHSYGCESNYVLAHYQVPRSLLCLWDKLQREHEPICCE